MSPLGAFGRWRLDSENEVESASRRSDMRLLSRSGSEKDPAMTVRELELDVIDPDSSSASSNMDRSSEDIDEEEES